MKRKGAESISMSKETVRLSGNFKLPTKKSYTGIFFSHYSRVSTSFGVENNVLFGSLSMLPQQGTQQMFGHLDRVNLKTKCKHQQTRYFYIYVSGKLEAKYMSKK